MPDDQKDPSWHRRAAKNVALGGLAYGLDTLLVLIYTLLLARSLGARDFGAFSFSISLALAAYLPVDFGTSLAVVRGTATRSLNAPLFRRLVAFRWACVPVLALLAGIGARAAHASSVELVGIVLLFVSEGFACVTNAHLALLRGGGKLERILVVSALEKMMLIGLLFSAQYAAWWSVGGLVGVGIAFVVARALSLIAAIVASRSGVDGLQNSIGATPSLREFMSSARHLGAFLVVERGAFYLIPILLTMVSGQIQTGLFQACVKVALVPIALTSALANGLYPILADIAAAQPAKVAAPFRIALMLNQYVAAIAIALMIASPRELLGILFGPGYSAAGNTLSLLSLYVAVAAIWQLVLYALTATGQDRLVFRASLCSLIITSIGVLGLGARMGSAGAAIALGIGQAVALTICLPTLTRGRLLTNPVGAGLAAVPAPALLVFAGLVIRQAFHLGTWGLVLVISAVSLVSFPLVGLVLGFVRGAEWNVLLHSLRRRS